LLLSALCYSLPAFGIHLPVKTYTVADGLLRDSVYKIKQDSNGFLWLCTPEGLSRFDGYGFTNFTTDDGLPDRHINDLVQLANGTIYVASDGGLARLDTAAGRSDGNALFTIFRPPDAAGAKFQVLLPIADGTLLCGTSEGIFVFDGTRFQRADMTDVTIRSDVLDLKQVSDGTIWAATASNGVYYSTDGLHFAPGPRLPDTNVPALAETHDGKLWIGLRPGTRGGLCRMDVASRQIEKCYFREDGLPSGWITGILETRDRTLWVATTKSLCQWQGDGTSSVCKIFAAKNDICDDDIWGMLEDKDNNLWVGTKCGLKTIATSGFSYFDENDGLGRGTTNSIFEDRSGRLYATMIVPEGRQIAVLDGDVFRATVPKLSENVKYFGWGWKQTVLEDSMQSWWVPTGSGLFRSPPNTSFELLGSTQLQRTTFPPGDREVFRLFEDSNENIWLATTGAIVELWRWDRRGSQWRNLTYEAGIGPTRQVTAFAEDETHNVWIATGSDSEDTALIRMSGDSARVFSKSFDPQLQGWLRDIYFDDQGRLWAASTATGLLRIDEPNAERPGITRYARSDGLSSNGVYCVTQDRFGFIYAGTGRGLDRLDPDDRTVENFTTFDGLPDSTVEICYRDHTGSLWFGTDHGLARYVPQPQRPRTPPALLMTGLRVNGASENISMLGETNVDGLELSPSQRSVSVDFVGLGATLGEKLRYEYSLNGTAWTPTTERTLNFADLRSGKYVLTLRAITRDGIATDAPATLSFTIATPLWQRWWFVLAMVLIAATIAYYVYRGRVSKLLELERTRTRIATDLHDDIGSNLSKIALLSELVKMKLTNGNEENGRMLATIADVSRATVDSMRDIVWSINPQRDSLLDLTRRMREHAEDALVPSGVAVNFVTAQTDLDHTIPMEVRREVFLIFKEAINNAARHSGCTQVDVELAGSGGDLSITVADDGRGFDIDMAAASNGLLNMRLRAERIGALFEITSAAGRGTRASIVLSGRGRPAIIRR